MSDEVKKIHGTDIPYRIFRSDKYPDLEVSIAAAPSEPEKIMAFSYLECIEDRRLNTPSDISAEEAKDIAVWVLEGGHTPALESLNLIINIRGMSKVVSHQIVRHRIGVSIDQRTQRANSTSYLGAIAKEEHYIIPPSIMNNPKAVDIFRHTMEVVELAYNNLTSLGIHEDEARYIIPQASETSMNFKVIYKSLMEISKTRLCELMQGELVEIFRLIKLAVDEYNPLLGSYLKPICFVTGRCNRNENNPNESNPNGVCIHTRSGNIPVRVAKSNAFDLTKYSRSASEIGK